MRLPAPSAVDVIASRFDKLHDILAKRFTGRFALTHALLASVRVPEIVITNHDNL